jgi:SAM-dependent methyltransferase
MRARIHGAPAGGGPIAHDAPDAARLGNPSFVWRSGQERRLAIIERYVPLAGRRVLDLGCGLGEYVRGFARQGAHAYGCDVAHGRLAEARRRGAGDLVQAAGEALPYADASFDVVVLNEVIEHVSDDRATMREVARVLAPGGICVIYAPNRLYPFETHGVYLGKRYVFGNIPLVNWLPNVLRNRLVPHARAYTARGIERVATAGGLRIVDHGYVYPGFDNIEARARLLAGVLRSFCYRAEDSPALRRFGLSHLLVLQRPPTPTEATA